LFLGDQGTGNPFLNGAARHRHHRQRCQRGRRGRSTRGLGRCVPSLPIPACASSSPFVWWTPVARRRSRSWPSATDRDSSRQGDALPGIGRGRFRGGAREASSARRLRARAVGG
jgi:hypothetical protein